VDCGSFNTEKMNRDIMLPLTRIFCVFFILGAVNAHGQDTTPSQEASQDSSQAQASIEQTQQEKEQQEYMLWANALWESMTPQTGNIALPGNVAELNVPDDFYYLNSQDSRKVLEDIWGNPPGSADGMLGMLFPAGATPFEGDSWGVTIEYQQDGYVTDEDADEINYDDLLAQMQEDTQLSSEERVTQGYEAISLIGWAAKPYYDEASNKLHWAKELKFGDAPVNTLNYNIRVLGRKGVLVLNFIAGMDQLPLINQNLDTVLTMADFKEGSKYADFNPEIDDVAAYGIGALVAGKVLAKTGLIAAALVFLKKFGVIIVLALGAFARKLYKGRKSKAQESKGEESTE
tara:strand:- start:62261 stop:63298 length:1038 start_codon:yes stop_codon:yes gene_type:complete